MKSKSKILVVSYNIPRPDRSSGELRFVSILQLLSEFWEIDFCVAPSHAEYNTSDELIPFIQKLTDIGIHVLPLKKDAFKEAIEERIYIGGYFNLFWIAEEVMPLFKIAQPKAFTIVDSVDVHYAREETQAKRGELKQSQVLRTKKRELGVYKAADVTIAVSKDDYHLLSNIEGVKNVFLIPNIVAVYPRTPGKRKPIVSFIGSYTWYPNPDAVKWFASSIWPLVIKTIPQAEFLIIGSDPTEEVKALDKIPGIQVIGYVAETKPYFEMAAVSVAPMRVGGGMKGKVNEAMAYAVPVVATKIGAQGFEAVHGKQMMISDDADEFADCVIKLLQDDILQHDMGIAGQKLNSAICSHEAVKEKIAELVIFCEKLVPGDSKHFSQRSNISHIVGYWFKNSKIIKGLKYLKREGIKKTLHRVSSYNKSPSKLEPKQHERINYNLVKPSGIIEFPTITDAPLVSIVIPVYNQWEYTFTCLDSILKNSGNILYEIILADDNSTDDTQLVEKLVKNIRVIRNKKNIGFLFNCNNAAKVAQGEYIIFLNNDTLVQPDWLYWLVKTMEEKPDVGMVGAKLIFSTGKLQEAGGVVFKDGSAMNYGRGDDPDKPQYNYLKDVDYCSGACICVRKDIWKKLDGFDPQFAPAYYEDTDLAMRIRSLGYRTVYQPKSIVIHFDGISHGTDITKGIKKKQDDNQKIFYSKWAVDLDKNNYKRDENLFKARDKSKHKQTVLLIDYNVPSNSVNSEKTAQMVNHFIESDFNIKFLPDNFLRPDLDIMELEQAGVEILYGEYYRENWLLWIIENAGNIDLICFVDESLANKYLPILKSMLKHDFLHVIYGQENKNEYSIIYKEKIEELMSFPAGHYYSPVVNVYEIQERQVAIWKAISPSALPGIDLNVSEQLQLVEEFSKTYQDIPFSESKNEKFRYYYENPFFSYSDGIFLHSFIKYFKPARIIEIGSGFSSALMLDTIQYLDRPQIRVSFIEPYPERLYSLITEKDKQQIAVFEKNLQQIEISFFEQLHENDILFIDSTHVAKTGSDVNYLIFEILPSLNKGVLIHFHDVFYPFEYPKEWVLSGRSWNEDYMLRSFLMYNDNFKIVLFPHFIHQQYGEYLANMPNCYKNSGGSFWIQKVK